MNFLDKNFKGREIVLFVFGGKNMYDSQKKANEKWNLENKERLKYLKDRSGAFSFVNPTTKAKKKRLNGQSDYIDDLRKLKKAVQEKLSDHDA